MTLFDHHWVKAFRQDALAGQGGKCCYCRSGITARTATGDHIKPRKKNGKTTRDNIAAACESCNMAKGPMSEPAFLSAIKKPPTAGTPFYIQLAWMRRKINLRAERVDLWG